MENNKKMKNMKINQWNMKGKTIQTGKKKQKRKKIKKNPSPLVFSSGLLVEVQVSVAVDSAKMWRSTTSS